MQALNEKTVTVDVYLKDELLSEVKRELIDGQVYAMAGASKNHERISMNLSRQFGNHLENSPCEPFGSDTKVRVGNNFFYPDVIIVCDDKNDDEYYTYSPVIIVEVLSKSTRKKDEMKKRKEYLSLPSLQEYVLIEQDFVKVIVSRRGEGWFPQNYYMGDDVTFESIGLTLSVADIYHRVKNEEMTDYLERLAEQEEQNTLSKASPASFSSR